MILQLFLAMLVGWIQRHQGPVTTDLQAESRLLKAQLSSHRLRLTDTDRRRLAALASPIGRKRLKEITTIATPDALLRWSHRLIAQKFDGSKRSTQLGRPPVAEEAERLAVQMAEENPTWGYRRIQGALADLGHHIDAIMMRNILRRHHLEPAPQRRQVGMSWAKFLKRHWEVLAATDFFTVEVATWRGLMTYDVLLVMELATRRVYVAGITPHPTDVFNQPCARRLTDAFDGFLLGTRYLIHNRGEKLVHGFDRVLRTSGVEPVVLPPRGPNLNAHCERVVRSIREEVLYQLIIMGEESWRFVLTQHLAHDHAERNHQGLRNQLIEPEVAVGRQTGQVIRRERLGGRFSDSHREAA
jgi:putative transposase